MKELELFKKIIQDRGYKSEISDKPLFREGHPQFHWQFAHVLAKGTFKKFKFYEKNIVLMTPEEHYLFDSGSTINLPEYSWVHELRQELKQEYYKK